MCADAHQAAASADKRHHSGARLHGLLIRHAAQRACQHGVRDSASHLCKVTETTAPSCMLICCCHNAATIRFPGSCLCGRRCLMQCFISVCSVPYIPNAVNVHVPHCPRHISDRAATKSALTRGPLLSHLHHAPCGGLGSIGPRPCCTPAPPPGARRGRPCTPHPYRSTPWISE
jgi:hypothetical protein